MVRGDQCFQKVSFVQVDAKFFIGKPNDLVVFFNLLSIDDFVALSPLPTFLEFQFSVLGKYGSDRNSSDSPPTYSDIMGQYTL